MGVAGLSRRWCEFVLLLGLLKYSMGERINVNEWALWWKGGKSVKEWVAWSAE